MEHGIVLFVVPHSSTDTPALDRQNSPQAPLHVPITALSVSRSLPLKDLASSFPGARVRSSRTLLVADYPSGQSLYCFDFGAIVFVGDPPQSREALLAVLSARVPAITLPPYEEDYLVRIDPHGPTLGAVRFDHIEVPAWTDPLAELVSRLLAQSAALERYGDELDGMLAALEQHTAHMSTTGRVGAGHRVILQQVARCVATKNQIVGKLSLLDKPDLAWESESLDHLHDQLRVMLELDDRFAAVEHKLRAVQDTVTLLLDALQARRELFLEATIVILIATEIALALLRII